MYSVDIYNRERRACLKNVTCTPKPPPDLCRARPTKGRTNEGTIYGRTDHCDDHEIGSWREDR